MQKILAALLFTGFLAAPQVQAASVQDRYAKSCAVCHASGVAGAPKKGDKAAWAPRIKQGDAVMLGHVKNGYKAMPPKGLCMDCSDAEFKALIKYLAY